MTTETSRRSGLARLLVFALLLCAFLRPAAGENELKRYLPSVHGTFRGLFEQSTVKNESRFQVRMARLSAKGYVLPFADYFVQADLCDRGKFKILDVFVTLHPTDNLSVMAGQMRVPFSATASRAPHDYYFANRAFAGKIYGNLRSAGVKAGYQFPKQGLYFEGGVFNGTDMTDHSGWNNSLTYSVKANWTRSGFKPELAFMSRRPGGTDKGVRINQYNASLSWKDSHWFIEGEYILRHYTDRSFSDSQVLTVYADYGFAVRSKWVNRCSFQARLDAMSDMSNGILNESGLLTTTIPGCKRATVGATASYNASPVHLDFKLNYEQYFYSSGVKAPSPGDDSKLVGALILYF